MKERILEMTCHGKGIRKECFTWRRSLNNDKGSNQWKDILILKLHITQSRGSRFIEQQFDRAKGRDR